MDRGWVALPSAELSGEERADCLATIHDEAGIAASCDCGRSYATIDLQRSGDS